FNHDGHLDVAILTQGGDDVSIFLGDGHGGFSPKGVLGARQPPPRPSVADGNRGGTPHPLAGNDVGHRPPPPWHGARTFRPYQRTEHNVALAVADLNDDGRPDFIFANQGLDHVSVQYAQPGQSFVQDRSDGLLAPGAVAVADLNGDGLPDLVVANSGAN